MSRVIEKYLAMKCIKLKDWKVSSLETNILETLWVKHHYNKPPKLLLLLFKNLSVIN